MTYEFNVEYGLMAKASDATLTYSVSCKTGLHNQVLPHTSRNAEAPNIEGSK